MMMSGSGLDVTFAGGGSITNVLGSEESPLPDQNLFVTTANEPGSCAVFVYDHIGIA